MKKWFKDQIIFWKAFIEYDPTVLFMIIALLGLIIILIGLCYELGT